MKYQLENILVKYWFISLINLNSWFNLGFSQFFYFFIFFAREVRFYYRSYISLEDKTITIITIAVVNYKLHSLYPLVLSWKLHFSKIYSMHNFKIFCLWGPCGPSRGTKPSRSFSLSFSWYNSGKLIWSTDYWSPNFTKKMNCFSFSKNAIAWFK